ncbi:MAG: nucleotidyltransferase family protein [Pseudomonadota bacterium]
MKTLLLAAGLGTRLRPLTETTPKCLVPIKGQPLLDIWLNRLTAAGLGPFLINTHYLSSQIESYVEACAYKEAITLVHEPVLLGTAGTLIKNLAFFQGEDGLLIHADNYCLQDFKAFLQAHERRPAHCVMTMMTFRTDNPTSCGIVEIDANNVVTGFHEKVLHPPGNLASGAIYVLSAELQKTLETTLKTVSDFSTEVIGKYLGRIYTFETHQPLVDIGTAESYARVNCQ